MENLLDKYEAKPIKEDQIMEGKIIEVGKAKIFVDLGPKGTGVILGREFYRAKNELKDLEIGNKIPVKVVNPDNQQGYIELSLKDASKELTWDKLKEKQEKDQSFKVKILGANKGGLLAKVSGINAFLPASQLSAENYPKVKDGDKTRILEELQKLVGEELEVKILDLNPKEDKLILSEKATNQKKIKEALKSYNKGDIVEGEVTGTANFGAFVRFTSNEGKEIEGLIHISELDWRLVEKPEEIVNVGEKVKAEIVNIDEDKVSLSLKALKENPWKEAAQKYKKGDKVKGKVTKFDSFGAFVELSSGIQGLCHISEFGSQEKMFSALEKGKEYSFRVQLVNPDSHKIILSFENEKG